MLSQIPSPSTRLWVGLCITLSIFGVFAFYASHEVRWLEDFQTNVVQKNRLASLQLLRLQEDAYFLAISLRDMTLPESRYPIGYWRGEYTRVREEMKDALEKEAQYSATTPAGNEKRAQLRDVLADFWETADEAFTLADEGHEETARYVIRSQLETKRESMSRLIQSLLTLNDQAQAEAGRRITLVYGQVKRDILLVVSVLFLVALGTGLYTLQANRKTFERIQHLAEKLQLQNEQLEALYQAISVVSQEQELAKVLQDVCEQLSRALGVRQVTFLRHQSESAGFVAQAACGMTSEESPNEELVSLLTSSAHLLEEGKPVILPAGSRSGSAAADAGSRQHLILPLSMGSALFGVFALAREPGADALGDDELQLASKIVEATLGPLKNAQLLGQLKSQSEQLRKLSWKLIEVQEETLRQVARDLHDEFGQILTAIGVMLGRAGQKGLDKDSVFVQDVQKVKKIVEDTLQTVRDSSQIFRPAILDDFGLEQTLRWFATQFSRQTGVRVHFRSEMADSFFPGEDAIHLYRIVQEALNNIARHSKAQEAWVALEEAAGELSLEIRDNGIGFDPASELVRASGEGLGLMGMRERAEHLKGSFSIRSAPHQGTVVQVRIPLQRAAARPAAEKVI
ncbi:MAG: GAF domain-containing sensor histidine kinase [Terriglobia bacterium]